MQAFTAKMQKNKNFFITSDPIACLKAVLYHYVNYWL